LIFNFFVVDARQAVLLLGQNYEFSRTVGSWTCPYGNFDLRLYQMSNV